MTDEPLEIRVKAMQPASHTLEARWWIQPATLPQRSEDDEASRVTQTARKRSIARTQRGALDPIEERPIETSLHDADAEHTLLIRPNDLEPGVYRVVCRVKDTTELRGERWPWVLKDERGLLESERVWWIEVPAR